RRRALGRGAATRLPRVGRRVAAEAAVARRADLAAGSRRSKRIPRACGGARDRGPRFRPPPAAGPRACGPRPLPGRGKGPAGRSGAGCKGLARGERADLARSRRQRSRCSAIGAGVPSRWRAVRLPRRPSGRRQRRPRAVSWRDRRARRRQRHGQDDDRQACGRVVDPRLGHGRAAWAGRHAPPGPNSILHPRARGRGGRGWRAWRSRACRRGARRARAWRDGSQTPAGSLERSHDGLSLLLVAFALLAVGVVWLERGPDSAKELALIATLGATAAAGRVLFAAIPGVQPVTVMTVAAGAALGARSGFAVGALAAFVSNFFLGQGTWTPWQMLGWGACGVAGAMAPKLLRHRFALAAFCFAVDSGTPRLGDAGSPYGRAADRKGVRLSRRKRARIAVGDGHRACADRRSRNGPHLGHAVRPLRSARPPGRSLRPCNQLDSLG